jgi:hypothetical protein
MRSKRRTSARIGFANDEFLKLLSNITGISPVGELGRETPLDLTDLGSARGSLLLREVFSKFDDGKPSKEKEETTWKKFHEAEQMCQQTNLWVDRCFRYDPFWIRVRGRIRDTLGQFTWDEASRNFAFGPGSTTRLRRKSRFAAYKYSGQPESTSGNARIAVAAIAAVPVWNQTVLLSGGFPYDPVKVVPGNRVVTVPKNYKTDRTIAIEPCMNIYVQKGIGRCIRNRLKRVGIDLDDQTPNQRAARKGSEDGSLATIDLSMASDTVSKSLVDFLLPLDWLSALEQSRSAIGVLPSGESLTYQKFSSMGNGYTFELETLIFWAIAQEVCCRWSNEKDMSVLVYGDDIVVPADKYDPMCKRLWQAGFKPNPLKSFAVGPYRESCGKHYFCGVDITPFYVRKPVVKLDRLFLCHNNLYRWSDRCGQDVNEVLTKLRSLAPATWREPRLPDGFGDGAFIGAIDELRLDSHPFGWEHWLVKVLVPQQDRLLDELPEGQLVSNLVEMCKVSSSPFEGAFRAYSRAYGGREIIPFPGERTIGFPTREGTYRVANILVPQYPSVK